jgi:hypothetical protein
VAYVREEKESFEIDFPLEKIWEAVPKVIENLDWTIEETDQATHHFKVKTKGGFLSYGSIMKIDLSAENEKTTKLSLSVETPVTTITSMADYGRSGERMDMFVAALAKLMGVIKPK